MEAFIKVYIKSEDDLPKEDGDYVTNLGKWSFEPWDEDDNFVWLSGVKWYLKPVEIPEITDEEIEVEASDLADPSSKKDFSRGEWLGFKEGAKWYREELKKRLK